MITESMKAWGLVFAVLLRDSEHAWASTEVRILLAADDAMKVFPLEPAEIAEIKQMARAGRLGELLEVEHGKTGD